MSAIVSPITSHANRTTSHRTGWARMWAECLGAELAFKDPWLDEEIVYFEHGMEFKEKSKGVNVFLKDSRSWDSLAVKAKQIQGFSGQLFSLDIDCPDYGERLQRRVRPHSSPAYRQLDFAEISRVCASAKTLKQCDLDRKSLVLGDSHAIAAWRPDAYLTRLDGQTLNGALNLGFSEWIKEYAQGSNGSELSSLRTYFGNIDIRHHICRLAEDASEQRRMAVGLADRYLTELLRCKEAYKLETVEIVAALPIENETRRLPKTGYYKGQPFWGSWAERNDVCKAFNDALRYRSAFLGFDVIEWPDHFINEASELDFDVMEKPRSVHVSPEHYLWSI
jgi:hypothetical protein